MRNIFSNRNLVFERPSPIEKIASLFLIPIPVSSTEYLILSCIRSILTVSVEGSILGAIPQVDFYFKDLFDLETLLRSARAIRASPDKSFLVFVGGKQTLSPPP